MNKYYNKDGKEITEREYAATERNTREIDRDEDWHSRQKRYFKSFSADSKEGRETTGANELRQTGQHPDRE